MRSACMANSYRMRGDFVSKQRFKLVSDSVRDHIIRQVRSAEWGKVVTIDGWDGREKALAEIEASRQRWVEAGSRQIPARGGK